MAVLQQCGLRFQLQHLGAERCENVIEKERGENVIEKERGENVGRKIKRVSHG